MNTGDIRAIIFDVDGTLYKSNTILSGVIYDLRISEIRRVTNCGKTQAEEKYNVLKEQYGSTTKVLEALGAGTLAQISRKTHTAQLPVKEKVLKKDPKLISLIMSLRKNYKLYTLRNGLTKGTLDTIRILGLTKDMFDGILPTIELGVAKPDKKPFEHALKKINQGANQILMVGDRVSVDLAPARILGMKTCLVTWGNSVKKERKVGVDFVIDKIYDVEKMFA